MNYITVPAFGAPNSYARSVQENPEKAVEAIRALKEMWEWQKEQPELLPDGLADKVKRILTQAGHEI